MRLDTAAAAILHCAPHPWASPDAVRQMLAVAKTRGLVCLGHNQNEAEREGYLGFHQWNFTVDEGDFVIWSKQERINVSQELGSAAHVDAFAEKQWVTVHIRKLRIPTQGHVT